MAAGNNPWPANWQRLLLEGEKHTKKECYGKALKLWARFMIQCS